MHSANVISQDGLEAQGYKIDWGSKILGKSLTNKQGNGTAVLTKTSPYFQLITFVLPLMVL